MYDFSSSFPIVVITNRSSSIIVVRLCLFLSILQLSALPRIRRGMSRWLQTGIICNGFDSMVTKVFTRLQLLLLTLYNTHTASRFLWNFFSRDHYFFCTLNNHWWFCFITFLRVWLYGWVGSLCRIGFCGNILQSACFLYALIKFAKVSCPVLFTRIRISGQI